MGMKSRGSKIAQVITLGPFGHPWQKKKEWAGPLAGNPPKRLLGENSLQFRNPGQIAEAGPRPRKEEKFLM